MNTTNHKALVETLKSIGRGLWFGVLGLIVVALTALVTSGQINDVTITVAGLTVNLAVVIVAAVGYLAKVIDTYVHNSQTISANGLAPAFLQKPTTTAPAMVQPTQPVAAPAPVVQPNEVQTQMPVADATQQPVDPTTLNS